MSTAQEMFDALCLPFPTMYVKWRIGSTNKEKTKGLPLCYVDARAVMDRLDSVCGLDGWQCNYTPAHQMLICNIGIRSPDGEWIWKSDGAGATDFEGEKGMSSDAFKRAAVRFGIGRYLYDLKTDWAPIEDGKKFSAEVTKELNRHHDEKVEEWGWDIGYRPGAYVFRLLGATIKDLVTDAATAQEWLQKNDPAIRQLPVRMRQRIKEQVELVGATQSEASAA